MLRFFKKDYRHYVEKGEKHLLQGRYADAKFCFNDALDFVDISSNEGKLNEAFILSKLAEVNNALAGLNLEEASSFINSGNLAKAEEHLQIVLELAEDVILREKAENLRSSLTVSNNSAELAKSNFGCSGCGSSHADAYQDTTGVNDADETLTPEERFELLIAPLPAPLPERYASLGREFAYAFIAIHDGNDVIAAPVLEKMLAESENDIICHELALIRHRQNDVDSCESYLRKAIQINPLNPLCLMALVHLLLERKEPEKAIPLLEHMVNSGLLVGHAQIILGDIHSMLGNDAKAMDILSKALTDPTSSRDAAERLVMLLLKQNRASEAEFLKKQYLKKCC